MVSLFIMRNYVLKGAFMAIYFDKQTKTFYLESKESTYAFRVSEFGFLNHLYFGKKIARDDLNYSVYFQDRGHENFIAEGRLHSHNQYLNECPTIGRSDYRESMIALNDSRYSRISELKYASHKIYNDKPILEGMPSLRGGKTLAVTLKDEYNESEVILYYTVYDELPVILRRTEIINKGKKPLKIDRAYSFALDLDDEKWDAITLHGAWARERFIERTPLHHGIFAIDSKRCASSGQINPFMALCRKNADEDSGEVLGFNLVYSGDFVFKAQVNQIENTRVLGGINDYDFEWELGKGEKFSTPEAVMVYSDGGIGKMSRIFHDLYRKYLINPRYVDKIRPIVINNWEATYFDFDTKKLCDIIDSVKGTGIDTLVLDDGWFGERNSDKTSLGDWYVNMKKLPGGLKPIIDHAHKNGMKFGLWIEPEMISENSELYKAHPDWAIQVPGIKPCHGRDQQILDLTRDEVVDYVIEVMSKILSENDIDYIKWDMNRTMTENYSEHLGKNNKEIHHRYILGVYKICEALVNGFPHIFFEGCSAGGARFDPAMLYYFPQFWTSDDTDAYMRTFIQYGTSLCYPLSSMSCHVADCPNHQTGRTTPFNSRADIAHLGATGYELDTTKFSDEIKEQVKEQVKAYKEMEDLVLFGDLYRLDCMQNGNYFAEQIVSKDKSKSHITVMRAMAFPNFAVYRIYPKGLDANAKYFIKEENITLSGSTIMNVGLVVKMDSGDFITKTYSLKKV